MNIYQIEQELLSIFEELEENGGELTEELSEKLTITQDEFKDKVESYSNVIKKLKDDCRAITTEINRLKGLYETKSKTIDRLEAVLIKAITEFGDTKKSGAKFVDYGTGEVSIRKTKAIEVNESLVSTVNTILQNSLTYTKNINQLDVYDRIDIKEITKEINDNHVDIHATDADINNINANISLSIPISDLANGKGYQAIKEILKYTDIYKLSTSVSKTDLKPMLEENGSCVPNLAKIKINESLSIK